MLLCETQIYLLASSNIKEMYILSPYLNRCYATITITYTQWTVPRRSTRNFSSTARSFSKCISQFFAPKLTPFKENLNFCTSPLFRAIKQGSNCLKRSLSMSFSFRNKSFSVGKNITPQGQFRTERQSIEEKTSERTHDDFPNVIISQLVFMIRKISKDRYRSDIYIFHRTPFTK